MTTFLYYYFCIKNEAVQIHKCATTSKATSGTDHSKLAMTQAFIIIWSAICVKIMFLVLFIILQCIYISGVYLYICSVIACKASLAIYEPVPIYTNHHRTYKSAMYSYTHNGYMNPQRI